MALEMLLIATSSATDYHVHFVHFITGEEGEGERRERESSPFPAEVS